MPCWVSSAPTGCRLRHFTQQGRDGGISVLGSGDCPLGMELPQAASSSPHWFSSQGPEYLRPKPWPPVAPLWESQTPCAVFLFLLILARSLAHVQESFGGQCKRVRGTPVPSKLRPLQQVGKLLLPHSWMLFVAPHELFHGDYSSILLKWVPQLQIYPFLHAHFHRPWESSRPLF